VTRTHAETITLLQSAIDRSGLSARQYAMTVLLRDERTIRRWLAGDAPIPAAVVAWLKNGDTDNGTA
jgi:hypothetical protein